MIKICLIEDEEYALKSLYQKIIDLDGPYEIVCAAYNGIDAVGLILEHRPDVVITDIRMPDMDGIALAEYLSVNTPDIITVISSGYQEFEYAKQALKLGVKDYLLKPIVPGELKACLLKCEEKVNEKKNAAHIEDIYGVKSILSSDIPIHWEDGGYVVYLIFGNAASGAYSGIGKSIVHPNGFYVSSQDIENRFRQRFEGSNPVFCFIGVYSNEKVIIIQKAQKGNPWSGVLLKKFYDLAGELEKEYKYSVTVSYLPIDKTDINTRINLCRKLAIQNILLGVNNVVSDASGSGHSTRNLNDIISCFSLYLRQTLLDSLKTKVQALFTEWHEDRYPLAAIQNDLIYVTNSLKHSMPQSLLIPENHEYTIAYYIDEIAAISNDHSDFAENYYNLLLELFIMPLSDGNVMSAAQLVEKIEGFFLNNLSSHITLSMLCSEMNYSKVHLCRIFKKQKHTTPIGYFIQLKIEKAQKIILECPALTLADIADSLGFDDVYYFSKVFKRVTGQTPSAVRERARQS